MRISQVLLFCAFIVMINAATTRKPSRTTKAPLRKSPYDYLRSVRGKKSCASGTCPFWERHSRSFVSIRCYQQQYKECTCLHRMCFSSCMFTREVCNNEMVSCLKQICPRCMPASELAMCKTFDSMAERVAESLSKFSCYACCPVVMNNNNTNTNIGTNGKPVTTTRPMNTMEPLPIITTTTMRTNQAGLGASQNNVPSTNNSPNRPNGANQPNMMAPNRPNGGNQPNMMAPNRPNGANQPNMMAPNRPNGANQPNMMAPNRPNGANQPNMMAPNRPNGANQPNMMAPNRPNGANQPNMMAPNRPNGGNRPNTMTQGTNIPLSDAPPANARPNANNNGNNINAAVNRAPQIPRQVTKRVVTTARTATTKRKILTTRAKNIKNNNGANKLKTSPQPRTQATKKP